MKKRVLCGLLTAAILLSLCATGFAATLQVMSLTPDKVVSQTGTTATYSAVAAGGTLPYRYSFSVYRDNALVSKTDYDFKSSLTYTFTEAGTYVVEVSVLDAVYATDTLRTASFDVTAPLPLRAVSVTTPVIPSRIGDTAAFTLSAEGGVFPYTYAFYVIKDGTVVYSTGYTASPSVSYTFSDTGSYVVRGFVKDSAAVPANSNASSAAISIGGATPVAATEVTVTGAAAKVGDTAYFTTSATGGSLPYTYAFYILRDNAVMVQTDYSASPVYGYTFKLSGSYTVIGLVKDALGNTSSVSTNPLVISPADVSLRITSVTPAKIPQKVGEKVTFTAVAKGGTQPYTYAFYVYKDGVKVYNSAYSKSNQLTYAFSVKGSYQITAFVKDSKSASAWLSSAKYTVPYVAPSPLAISSLTYSQTAVVVDGSASFSVLPTGGVEPYSYAFDVYKGDVIESKGAYQASQKLTYKFTSIGIYKVVAYLKGADGTIVSKTTPNITVTAPAPLTISSVSASKSSSLVDGSVTFTANAAGGVAPLRYAFYLYKGTTIYKKYSAYSTSNTLAYNFTETGSYRAQAFVKDATGKIISAYSSYVKIEQPLDVTNVSASKTSVIVGDSVSFATTAQGGTTPYRYYFYVYQGSTVVKKYSYSDSNQLTHAFTAAGSFKVRGYVKDATGKIVSGYSSTITVSPKPALAVTGVSASKTSVTVGDSVSFSTSATGGETPYRYCFYVYEGSTVVKKYSYSDSNKLTHTFASAGSFKVRGYVKDASGLVKSRYSATITVNPPPALSIKSMSASVTSATVGDSAVFTLTAAGGNAPYRYCFYVYKDGALVQKGTYGTSNKLNYTFSDTGVYRVKGHVKDADGTRLYLFSTNVTVAAAPKLSVVSVTVDKNSASVGDTVTATTTSKGGTAPVRYCFYVYNGKTCVSKIAYSDYNSATYTFEAPGSYNIKGFVKDADGTLVSKHSEVITVK